MTPLVIFGAGSFAEVAHAYFSRDGVHRVVAFTVHEARRTVDTLAGLPVIPFESLGGQFGPHDARMFVAVGYSRVNRIRAAVYAEAKAAGYTLASYISPKCSMFDGVTTGDNCFIFEDNTIQPFVRIGSNVTMWSGNHIGHHATIEDHAFISSHVVVSGHVRVGPRCFIGVNATMRDNITLGEGTVVGAGALIMKSTKPGEVYIAERTRPDRRHSDDIGF